MKDLLSAKEIADELGVEPGSVRDAARNDYLCAGRPVADWAVYNGELKGFDVDLETVRTWDGRDNPEPYEVYSTPQIAGLSTVDPKQVPSSVSEVSTWAREHTSAVDGAAPTGPRLVATELRSFSGAFGGFVVALHDGTRESVVAAAKATRHAAENHIEQWSNARSRTVVTSDEGRPAFRLSPNLKNLHRLDQDEAQQLWGPGAAEVDTSYEVSRENPDSTSTLFKMVAGGLSFVGGAALIRRWLS